MKTATWLCPVLTLLCATRLICCARLGHHLDYAEPDVLQGDEDDYFLEKRTKPSLSIVNPLDVLRQRLLLEIARRQMKENTRQVELNRAILKNVGKRMQLAEVVGRRYALLQPRMPLDYVTKTPTFDMLRGEPSPPAFDTRENNKRFPNRGTEQEASGGQIEEEINGENHAIPQLDMNAVGNVLHHHSARQRGDGGLNSNNGGGGGDDDDGYRLRSLYSRQHNSFYTNQ